MVVSTHENWFLEDEYEDKKKISRNELDKSSLHKLYT